MRFALPQFIGREPKIVGPFTFKQFIFIGMAGAICFVLYFSAPFYIFLIACIFLGAGALALAFVKVGGRSLPVILGNFLKFNLTPKIYIWRKTETPIKIVKKAPKKKGEIEEELPLKIAERSQLKKLGTKIETGAK